MVLVESFSGIRGIFGKDLTEDIATRYANAYMALLNKKTNNPVIVVGQDTRPSGPRLMDSIIKGLQGKIINLGVCPTPVIEHAVRAFQADGGIIISGSHNEPEHNGFKFLDKDGAILRPKDADFIIKKFNELKLPMTKNKPDEVIEKQQEALDNYKQLVKSIINEPISNSRIIIDPNGGAGIYSKQVFNEFGVNAFYTNMEQGNFKRVIEPKASSLAYLQEEINKQDAEFAVGFDCDADRVEILLRDGSLISGNQLLALIANEILSENNNPKEQTVVANDPTSYIVKEIAEKYGSGYKEVEVGEINVVDEMLKNNSPIGGEGSNGGVIFPPSRCRDGILTVLYILKILKKKEKSLKQLIEELPKYYYMKNYEKEKLVLKENFIELRNKVKDYYKNKGFEILETGDETGGLKAVNKNGWIWFRQSKTEDKVLRIISDSKDKEIAEALLKEAIDFVKG
jgi:phosphomannomutase